MWRDGDWKAGDEEKVARLLRGTVRRRPGTTLPHLLHALPVRRPHQRATGTAMRRQRRSRRRTMAAVRSLLPVVDMLFSLPRVLNFAGTDLFLCNIQGEIMGNLCLLVVLSPPGINHIGLDK